MSEADIRALVLSTIQSATKKISALPDAPSLSYGALIPVVQSGATQKATLLQFLDKTAVTVLTVQDLRDFDTTLISDNSLFYVKGITAPNDGGEGFYYYDTGGTGTDNVGTIVEPTSGVGRFYRLYSGPIDVRWFGLVCDGVTDDFNAWKKVVDVVNDNGGGIVSLPAGKTIFFGQHIVSGNGVTNPVFQSCNGLTIEGNGCTILVQGGFNRAAQTTVTVSGLLFYDCTQVVVRNLTIDGNNTTITKSGGVNEGFAYGVYFASCLQTTLENVYTVNWITDGVAYNISNVSNPCLACRDATMINCKSIGNARQGLSIIQLYGGTFLGCEFSNTGQTSYGNHSPTAGIDIEQDRTTATASPNQMDVNSGAMTFVSCVMSNNGGCACTSSFPDYTKGISWKNCVFDVGASNPLSSSFGVINDARDVDFIGCRFALYDRGFYATFTDSTKTLTSPPANYVNLIKCDIENTAELLHALQPKLNTNNKPRVPMLIQGNRFVSTKTSAGQTANVLYIANSGAVLRNNFIFIPAAGYVDEGSGRCVRMQIAPVRDSEDNVFRTDLLASAAAGNNAHYAAQYSETPLFGVRNEIYIGTAPGTADTIRPAFGATGVDTTFPCSLNTTHAGEFLRLGRFGEARQVTFQSASPSTGAWIRGDLCFNNNPSSGGPPAWSCTASGTPGTWKAFANLA